LVAPVGDEGPRRDRKACAPRGTHGSSGDEPRGRAKDGLQRSARSVAARGPSTLGRRLARAESPTETRPFRYGSRRGALGRSFVGSVRPRFSAVADSHVPGLGRGVVCCWLTTADSTSDGRFLSPWTSERRRVTGSPPSRNRQAK